MEYLALVALIGEALQIVEGLGALANSFFTAPEGTAFFVALTNYNARAINNFYSALKNRPIDDFLQLLAFRLGPVRLEDLMVFDPPLQAEEIAALDEAHLATATLVRKHMLNLAADWEQYRRFHHAYKHGLIVVNLEDVSLVEDRSERIDGICVWMRRQDGFGHIEPPYLDAAEYATAIGTIALDVLSYLVDLRLNVLELVELKRDGSWAAKPIRHSPWLWWFDKHDMSEQPREVILRRFGTAFS
jgi:hypothetical protein